MKTLHQWNSSKKDFSQFARAGEEIDGQLYSYMLGAVPPIYLENGFLLGEPFDTDPSGNSLYMAFSQREGRFYYDGLKNMEVMA